MNNTQCQHKVVKLMVDLRLFDGSTFQSYLVIPSSMKCEENEVLRSSMFATILRSSVFAKVLRWYLHNGPQCATLFVVGGVSFV